MEQQWISVNEPPKQAGAYLACNLDEWIDVCIFTQEEWIRPECYFGGVKVTHWMPLPKPPKQ